MGVFCLGFFVSISLFLTFCLLQLLTSHSPPQTCAITIIRIQYLKLSDDTTWDNVDSSCWSVSELASGIVCSCLPTLRPLLSHIMPSMGSRNTPSDGKYVHHSSGRDASGNSSGLGSKGKFLGFGGRSVVYPEDVELQTKSDSQDQLEKHAAVISETAQQPNHHHHHLPHLHHNHNHVRTASKDMFNRSASLNRGPGGGGARHDEGGYVQPDQLGLQPTVRTEVRAGSQQQQSRWTRPGEGMISVKHDLVVTQDYDRD